MLYACDSRNQLKDSCHVSSRELALPIFVPVPQQFIHIFGIFIHLFCNLNREKQIVRIFALTIKVSFNSTSIIVGINIVFIYFKVTLKVNSRANVLLKAVFLD